MALNKYKLGELLELSEEKNASLTYAISNVKGISIKKEFIETKADMDGVSLRPYLIVKPNYFSYVTITSRNGEKISLAHNTTEDTYIVSSSYNVFCVKRPDLLNSNYLYVYFNRPEFDRFSRFNSWGSAREAFSWADMCDIDINLPPLPIQQKYVDIYKAMQQNQRCFELGLDDLKLVCDGYIEDLRKKYPCEAIGPCMERRDERNGENLIKNVKGISVSKCFREPTSKVNRDKLKGYKIVRQNDIAFVQTTHNEKVFAFAHNNTKNNILVSSVNEVIILDKAKLLPEYLSLFFMRKEFDRYARFHSWGSAREIFSLTDLQQVKIPIPELSIQKSIVEIYQAYILRKDINEKLKSQIKDICPILIKGSVEEAKTH